MRLCFTLFVLLFTQLFFNLAHAAPSAGVNADQRKSQATTPKTGDRRKRKPLLRALKKGKTVNTEHAAEKVIEHSTAKSKQATVEKSTESTAKKSHSPVAEKKQEAAGRKSHETKAEKAKEPAVKTAHETKAEKTKESAGKKTHEIAAEKASSKKLHPMPSARKYAKVTPPLKGYKKGYGRHRMKNQAALELVANDQPIKMSENHKKRYQHAKLTAMSKLLSQMGKPYRWGGMSPNTGFDCSGLIYYAYKDVVRIHMPRTANEMFHLRDAAPIKKDDLESGDLVFFHITNRGAADHVGVYLGNGRFIESPRTGQDIRISYLNEDYWRGHYVGARRVVTPKTIR
jgi:murein DD-endopeptidase